MPKGTSEAIVYLVRRQYPVYGYGAAGSGMALRYSPGPRGDPAKIKEISERADALAADLAKKTPAELQELVTAALKEDAERAKHKAEKEERERFFNLPSSRADFDHYCKCAYWSADEAVALSLGRQPTVVNWKAVSTFAQVSPFAKTYALRRDLVTRAIGAKQLFDPMAPSIFLAWAKSTDVPVVAELTDRAIASGISLVGWQSLYEELLSKYKDALAKHAADVERLTGTIAERTQRIEQQLAQIQSSKPQAEVAQPDAPLGTRERENLQILAFIGAVKAYAYDPDQRTKAVPEIEHDTDRLGLRYSDDSIRAHLKAAHEMLPADWRARLGLKPKSGSA